MKFSDRPAGAEDQAFVKALLREEITRELGASDWPEPLKDQIVGMQVSARYSAVHRGFPGGESRVLQLDGEDAGWLYYACLESETRLVEIVVLTSLRGRGVGSDAVRRVIEASAGRPVRLHVSASNAGARRLYERLGFRAVGGDEVNVLMECHAAPSC